MVWFGVGIVRGGEGRGGQMCVVLFVWVGGGFFVRFDLSFGFCSLVWVFLSYTQDDFWEKERPVLCWFGVFCHINCGVINTVVLELWYRLPEAFKTCVSEWMNDCVFANATQLFSSVCVLCWEI